MHGKYNILFLCTGNSARSIIAEALVNGSNDPRVRAYSAGSHPTGRVNETALDLLSTLQLPIQDLRSKSWNEFAGPSAPVIDLVITVCDRAAGESCPIWPGHPLTSHWSVPDPAATTGSTLDIRNAYRETLRILRRRIELLLCLRSESLDQLAASDFLAEFNRRWARDSNRVVAERRTFPP